MKKMIFIIIGLWWGVTQIQAQITEFLVLEALISNHKSLSDKLKKRTGIDGSVALITDVVTDSTDVYRDDIVKMQKRVEGALGSVQFAAEIANLTMTAVDVAKHMTSAMDDAIRVSLKYPVLLDLAVASTHEAGDLIGDIYKLISMVAASGSNVVLATNENRAQFCMMVRDKLVRLDNVARHMGYMAVMYEHMGHCPVTGYTLDNRQTDGFDGTSGRAYDNTVDYIDKLINGL